MSAEPVQAIVDLLNGLRLCVVWKNQSGTANGGRMHLAPAGSPDIVGWRVRDGRFVGLEVKLPGVARSKATPVQLDWQARMRECGCLCGVVRTVAEAVEVVRG